MEENKLVKLVSYIKKSYIDPSSDNDIFTKLIIDENISILDIVYFINNIFCFDVIEWYYSINPKAYTKDKIDRVLSLVSLKYNSQLPKFEKFFDSINIVVNNGIFEYVLN